MSTFLEELPSNKSKYRKLPRILSGSLSTSTKSLKSHKSKHSKRRKKSSSKYPVPINPNSYRVKSLKASTLHQSLSSLAMAGLAAKEYSNPSERYSKRYIPNYRAKNYKEDAEKMNINGKNYKVPRNQIPQYYPQIMKANQIKNYNKQLVLPTVQKMGKKMLRYKQHAASLELEKLRRRKLDGDVAGQMNHYLNNLNKDYNVLEMKVLEGNALNLNALAKKPAPNYNYSSNNLFSSNQQPNSQFESSMNKFSMPLKKSEHKKVSNKDGVTHIDIRPTVNYKMIEPMEDIDPTIALNKKIDKLNKRRQKKFIHDMKMRQERIEYIRDMMRNMPLPPDLPQIYSFTNPMEFPLDFNMVSHNIKQRLEKQDLKENAEKINRTIILPLQNAILQLRRMREELPASKLRKSDLKDDILKLNDEIQDAMDSEEEEDLIEQMEIQKKQFIEARDEVDKRKKEISEAKVLITGLKQKAVEMLQSLANKEYMTNPDNIFDFPENNKIRHLSKEIQHEIGKATSNMMMDQQRMMGMMQQNPPQQHQRQRDRNESSSDSESGSYTGSSSTEDQSDQSIQ